MAKIKKRNLDSVKRAPVRKKSYEAPAVARRNKQVPKEYQTFQKASRKQGPFLWFLFLIFLATIGGFYYWSKHSTEISNDSIKLTAEGPKEIISGDQVSYKLVYENVDMVSMQQMELSVRWPDGFYFDEASIEPLDEGATTWLLEDIGPGEKVSIDIFGQLVGQKDDKLTASFSLSYQPANFHSDFKAKDSVETKIKDAKLSVDVEATDKTLVSTSEEIKINFTNLTKENLENLYIDILYPDDFQMISGEQNDSEEESNTEEDSGDDTDFVEEGDYLRLNLEPEQSKTLTINGMFTIDSKKDQLLVVEIGNMVEDSFRRLARVEKQIVVINPKFDMDFRINGQRGEQSVNWSDTLKYQLEITNQSEEDISDAVVSAMIDSFALDWDSLDTIGDYKEGKITWTKDQNEQLANWPAGESRVFTWQVDVVGEPQPERTVENIIEITIDGLADWQLVSSPVMVTIGETISFTNGVYWDLAGRRVGSGLLPPQVGEDTEYLVIWALPQATGFFDSVNVRTVLPPQVDFISETDVQAGDLEFDLAERSLTWNMEDFDNMILPITASFVIGLTPEETDKGQAMTLLNPTTVSATGIEDVVVRSKAIKTSDVVANSSEPIGIVR